MEKLEDMFETFCNICSQISKERGHHAKSKILSTFFDPTKYSGDKYTFLKLMLPKLTQRVYNLKDAQISKIFVQVLGVDQEEFVNHARMGDVSITCGYFFEKSTKIFPLQKSTLTIQQVDGFLDRLSTITNQCDHIDFFDHICQMMTVEDLTNFIRILKKDMRMDAVNRIIFDALSPDAYKIFQSSSDLKTVLDTLDSGVVTKGTILMTPFKPMLANQCKSTSQPFKSTDCWFVETKYDGERVQVHMDGDRFCFFSRNLKNVQSHKVDGLDEVIKRAFPHNTKLVLDTEILLYDRQSHKPLPFGTLGVHKKTGYMNANVCMIVFDLLHIDGRDLSDNTLRERKKILVNAMTVEYGSIVFPHQQIVTSPIELSCIMDAAIEDGLEGLVLKNPMVNINF